MPIDSRIDKELNCIIRTVLGEITGYDVKVAFTESLLDPDFKPNMHVIWDLTEADIRNIVVENLMDVIEHIRKNIDERGGNYKIIIVAPEDLAFGMSRMFKSYGYELPTSISVLRTLEEAYKLVNEYCIVLGRH